MAFLPPSTIDWAPPPPPPPPTHDTDWEPWMTRREMDWVEEGASKTVSPPPPLPPCVDVADRRSQGGSSACVALNPSVESASTPAPFETEEFLRPLPAAVSVAAPNCVENVAPMDALATGVASTLLPPPPRPTTGRCDDASEGMLSMLPNDCVIEPNDPSPIPCELCELNNGAIGSEAPCHAVSTNAS